VLTPTAGGLETLRKRDAMLQAGGARAGPTRTEAATGSARWQGCRVRSREPDHNGKGDASAEL